MLQFTLKFLVLKFFLLFVIYGISSAADFAKPRKPQLMAGAEQVSEGSEDREYEEYEEDYNETDATDNQKKSLEKVKPEKTSPADMTESEPTAENDPVLVDANEPTVTKLSIQNPTNIGIETENLSSTSSYGGMLQVANSEEVVDSDHNVANWGYKTFSVKTEHDYWSPYENNLWANVYLSYQHDQNSRTKASGIYQIVRQTRRLVAGTGAAWMVNLHWDLYGRYQLHHVLDTNVADFDRKFRYFFDRFVLGTRFHLQAYTISAEYTTGTKMQMVQTHEIGDKIRRNYVYSRIEDPSIIKAQVLNHFTPTSDLRLTWERFDYPSSEVLVGNVAANTKVANKYRLQHDYINAPYRVYVFFERATSGAKLALLDPKKISYDGFGLGVKSQFLPKAAVGLGFQRNAGTQSYSDPYYGSGKVSKTERLWRVYLNMKF